MGWRGLPLAGGNERAPHGALHEAGAHDRRVTRDGSRFAAMSAHPHTAGVDEDERRERGHQSAQDELEPEAN